METETKIQRILFATDFFESSRLTLDYAVSFAQHFKASIVMLHVALLSQAAREAELEIAGPSASRKAAEQRLHTLAEGVRHFGLHVETHVVDGFACEVILKSVKAYKADLLVLGIHGVHRRLGHLLIGSNTEKILLGAECPVLTVGAHVLRASTSRSICWRSCTFPTLPPRRPPPRPMRCSSPGSFKFRSIFASCCPWPRRKMSN